MSRLFLSHSSANDAEAVAIRDWLASEGWNEVFLDLDPERGIAAGERWERALNEAASRCEAVVFLISRDWLNSRWCLKEFNLARRLNKRLFGVLIEAIPIADLPADLTGAWQVVDLASGQDHTMFRVTLPRTQEEAHVTFSKEGLTRLRNGLTKAGLDARFFAWPPEQDPNRPPYRGLKPLEAEDAGIFFGRDAPIIEALDTLRGLKEAAPPRLLVILGASGAGKSSFLRAGLLPRLARDDRNFLPLPVIRPERAVISGETGLLHALEATFSAQGLPQSRASLREAISGGAEGLRPLLQQLVDKVFATLLEESEAKRPVIVLVIDQAEELFLSEGAEESEALLALIRGLAAQDCPGIIALFAIRSDSYDRLETAKVFEGMRQQTLPLLPMPRGAYQTVIEGPAARVCEANRKLTIEPQLTQGLLEDIETGGGSDALPLLAFTLEQLYSEYGGAGTLKLVDYQAFGGIRGAIEAAVDRALKAADTDPHIPRDQDARLLLFRRGLIPWLAGIDPETGSPRRRVARLADIPAESEPLIQLLVEQRLLATDRITLREGEQEKTEVTIEPAHEALLRQWGLLRGWLEEDFGTLTTLEGVKRAARDWAANGRHADWLNHAGTRLEDAEKAAARQDLAADLTSDAREYLRQCRAQDEKSQRTRRLRLRLTATAALVFACVAALAVWQWQQAQAQRDRAEHALTLATNTADGLIYNIAQKFRNVAGVPAALVKDILDQALKLQDQLIGSGETNPSLRRSQAGGLTESAQTLLALGDTNGALAAAKQAQAIMQSLVATEPENAEWQHFLSVSDFDIGVALVAEGKLDEALAAYRNSIAIGKALVAEDGSNTHWQRNLSLSDGRIGDVLMAQGKLNEALAAYQDSLAIAKSLVAKDDSNTEGQLNLSRSDNLIGDVLKAKGKLDEALAAYQDSLAIGKALVAKDGSNAEWQRIVSVSDDSIGDVLMAQGKLDEAFAAYRDSLAIRKALVAKDGSNTDWRHVLSISDDRIGDVLMAQGKLDEALAPYRDSLAIRKALVAKDGSNTEWQRTLSISDDRIGDVLMAQGKLDEALAPYRDSLAIRKALVAKDGSNAEWQRDVAISDDRIGDVLMAQGKLDEALAPYRDSLAIRKALVAKDPSNTDWQSDLSLSDDRIGDMLVDQGKREEALVAFRDSLPIRKALVAKDPSNTLWQRNLSVSDNKIGDVLLAQGKRDEALTAYRDSVAIANALVVKDASNTLWQRDVAFSGQRIGDVLLAQGKREEALAAYRDSVAIAKALVAKDASNTLWQRDVAFSDDRIGDILVAQGKLEEALTAYRDDLPIAKALVAKDPSNTQWQRDLSLSDEKIGDVLKAQGKLEEALMAYQDSLATAEVLVAKDPRSVDRQSDLAAIYDRLGDGQLKDDKRDEALSSYKKSLAIRRHLAETDTGNVQSQTDLVRGLYKLATVATGDEKDAAIRETVDILDRLDAEGKVGTDQKTWKHELLALRDASRRGWLGLGIENVPESLVPSLQLEDANGAMIAVVASDGPAQLGGLKIGDVIVAFDDNVVHDARGLLDLIAKTDVGQSVTVRLVRDGTSHSMQMAMGELKTQSRPESEVRLIRETSTSNDDNQSTDAMNGGTSESSTQDLDPALFNEYFKNLFQNRRE